MDDLDLDLHLHASRTEPELKKNISIFENQSFHKIVYVLCEYIYIELLFEYIWAEYIKLWWSIYGGVYKTRPKIFQRTQSARMRNVGFVVFLIQHERLWATARHATFAAQSALES